MESETRSAVATATRIAAGDDRTRYDALAVALLWLTVALVLILFGLAETWAWFDRPARHLMIAAHVNPRHGSVCPPYRWARSDFSNTLEVLQNR
jgi:hypothetical protein